MDNIKPAPSFPFIAYDATFQTKRQNSSVVRAHVMQRSHQERLANQIISDDELDNPVWSQYAFVAPELHGRRVLQWEKLEEEDVVSKPRSRKKKPLRIKLDGKEVQAIKYSEKRLSSAECEFEKSEHYKRLVKLGIKKCESKEVKSLMPRVAMEEGGMQLIRILDDYYGDLGDVSSKNNCWHTLWLPFAFSDQAMFHASLSKYSIHSAALRGKPITSLEVLRHKGMAMKKLSLPIADRKTKQPTDASIATALCLIGIEILKPDQSDPRSVLKAHIQGVRHMFTLRGGLSGLETDPLLVAGYLCYEYVLAALGIEGNFAYLQTFLVTHPRRLHLPSQTGIFSFVRVRFKPITPGVCCRDAALLLSAICKKMCVSDVFLPPRRSDLDEVEELEGFIKDFDERQRYANAKTKTPELEPSLRKSCAASTPSHSCSSYVFLSTHLRTLHKSKKFDDSNQPLKQLTRYQTEFPQFKRTSGIRLQIREERVTQLQHHLTKCPNHMYWTPLPGALLQCLIVGTSSSKDLPERRFFMAKLIRAACGLAVQYAEPVRLALATFYRLQQEQKAIVMEFEQ